MINAKEAKEFIAQNKENLIANELPRLRELVEDFILTSVRTKILVFTSGYSLETIELMVKELTSLGYTVVYNEYRGSPNMDHLLINLDESE